MAKEELKALIEDIEGFKEKCEVLHQNNFPTFFDDDDGNLHPKEYSLKLLVAIKEREKGFEEKDCTLQGKEIVKLYNDHSKFMFLFKNIFKELGRIDYEENTSLEETIIEA